MDFHQAQRLGSSRPDGEPRRVLPGREPAGGDTWQPSDADVCEGLLSSAFTDAGVSLHQEDWFKVCRSFVRQCKRRGFVSRDGAHISRR